MFKNKIVSAIIPARDEQESIGKVVAELVALKNKHGVDVFDHVIVCDNGSVDNTAIIAHRAGAVIVAEPKAGYGRACLRALAVMPRSDVIVFIDGDYAFYTAQSLTLVEAIEAGADLVIGSRAMGKVQPGALTLPQRFGNCLAAELINRLWQKPVTDLGPFRAISASALKTINMNDVAFGWTVEMQVKAIQHNLIIKEIPVDTRLRIGHSKISGTLRGVIGAAVGIFGTIFKLWCQEYVIKRKNRKHARHKRSAS